ncbi:MAG: hypothetical protein RL490_1635 [Pseudomonadota bacterium]|jgi:hypothetical protein
MTEALVEIGIGATRALVLDGDRVIEVHVERDDWGPRAGARLNGRLAQILVPGRRGIVRWDGGEGLLEPLPAITEGAALSVEVVREAIPEAARPRLPKLRAIPATSPAPGPDLAARLAAAGHRIVPLSGHGEDRLEAAGWSEQIEMAHAGHVPFPGGLLTISPTPAMTVIDVDGPGDTEALAVAAASAAAAAIRRFGITGSIGIDFPTLGSKAARQAVAAAIDAALPLPFERTAVNGFGFLQLVRPRLRPALVEAVRAPGFVALELLRRASRAAPGPQTLSGSPAVIAWLAARPQLIDALARRIGGAVTLPGPGGSATGGGHG